MGIPHLKRTNVAVLPMYPGIHASVLEALLATRPGGLILQSYGVGNPPDSNTELMTLLKQASKQGIVIVNLSQCHQGPVIQGAYATGSVLNEIGVVSGSDLTLEAAFTKLHWLLAQLLDVEQVRQRMAQALCGECSGNIRPA